MKISFTYSIFALLLTNFLLGQITITEVYYNTPYNEKLRFANNTINAEQHHRGEFIEIYNFSDKDINLKNWFIKDKLAVFHLPDKIILKGQFMVIAYSPIQYNITPFTEYFTTTTGKENQIILQDRIILRNKKEKITLGYSIDDLGIHKFDKKTYEWDFNTEPSGNYIHNIWQTPSAFYDVKSIQYHNDPNLDGTFSDTPNPLGANIVPPTISYAEAVKDDYQSIYAYLDWTSNVLTLINNICPINIVKVSQQPNGSSNNSSSCFSYDTAGNMIAGSNCNGSSSGGSPPSNTSGYTVDELNDIKNNIVLSPNPTKSSDLYQVNITWSGPALNKINNLQVFTSTGGLVYGFTPSSGVNSTSFNLQNQLPGVFVANFILNTGQVVSKNILRW